MIDRAAATEIARQHLAKAAARGLDLELIEKATIERPFGWVFFYQSRQFLETRDRHHCIRGNSPLIVDRRDGSLHRTGTARPVQYYIDRYERERPPDPA